MSFVVSEDFSILFPVNQSLWRALVLIKTYPSQSSDCQQSRDKPLTVHLHISDDFHQVAGSKIQWAFRAYPIFLVLWWASSANLYIETDYWKVKSSLHWPYTAFCRSGVAYCHSTKHHFMPPKRCVKQAGTNKYQNNCKCHRKHAPIALIGSTSHLPHLPQIGQ